MASEFKLKGVREMQERIRAITAAHAGKVDRALKLEAEAVKTTMLRKTVPVDANALRSSIRVGEVQRSGNDASVAITAGDSSAPYALAVHEHPSEHSPPSWQGKAIEEILSVRDRKPWSQDGRGPKYLERPLNAAIPGMAERIARAVTP